MVKTCTRCEVGKSLDDFYNCDRGKYGKKSRCKACQSELAAEWSRANPEKKESNRLKSMYGITAEEKKQMLAAQGGVCAICGTDKPGGKGGFHVDHNHKTNKVRGILCKPCNILIGESKESLEILDAAMEYLTYA